jgi:aminopeptidase
MTDPRTERLADILVTHATRLAPGERVLIETFDIPAEFTALLVRRAAAAGAVPLVSAKQGAVLRALYGAAPAAAFRLAAEVERYRMERVEAYIGVRGAPNLTELADVSHEQMRLYQTLWWKPVHLEVRVPKTKWVVLRWPGPGLAQAAGMSTEAFEDFYFAACTADYPRMAEAMAPLRARMMRTDRVRIVGPGTDLRFSIRGIPAVMCEGRRNIPDGEVFTAPLRDSAEGHVTFNTRALYNGVAFEGVRLEFAAGNIVRATADKADRLNAILDTDAGARFLGEFSLAFHPGILHPMGDALFDEKIAGSLHLTPGNAYAEAENGNRSAVHWDLVLIQRPEYGGGEVSFDGELVRKDGRFVVPDLDGLNPERLQP